MHVPGKFGWLICLLTVAGVGRIAQSDDWAPRGVPPNDGAVGSIIDPSPRSRPDPALGANADARGDIALVSHAIDWDSAVPEAPLPGSPVSYNEPSEPVVLPPWDGWAVGYDGGFTIASPDGLSLDTDDSAFLMKINSWGQFRYSGSDFHGPNPDFSQLEWERLRLVFKGHAYCPDLRYFIHLDADSDDGHQLDLLDYRITYDVGHDVLGWDQHRLALRLGRWKMPFSRFREEAVWRMEFTDFAMADWYFDVGRPMGVGLLGRWDAGMTPLSWKVALMNGIRTGRFETGRTDQLDRNFGVCGRLTSVLAGDFGSDGEPDLKYRDCPAWKVGAGFAFSRIDRTYGLREFEVIRVVDSGERLAAVLPAGVTAYDVGLFTIDSHVKYHGLSVIADYFFRSVSRFSGALVSDLFDHGFLLETGYFIVPEHLQLLARWSRVVGDSGTLGVTTQSADEVAGGVAWYIRGHNLKMTFDATHLNGAPIQSSVMNILPGDAGWLFRTQIQLRF